MASEVEKVVVELLAKVDGFDGKVKGSASAFGGSMRQIEQSGGRAEQAVQRNMAGVERPLARTQQASRNLGYQISDISTQLAGGASPFLILAQQGPQVANALDGAGGAVGRFAGFLSSWQGALVLAAGTLAAQLIPKLFETGESVDDLVKKLQEQERKTQDADKANALFGKTIEGVTKALNDNQEAIDKQKGAQDSAAEATLHHAEAQAREAIQIQTTTKALLEQAIAREQLAQSIGVVPGSDPVAAAVAQSQAASRITDLQAKLTDVDAQIQRAGQQIIQARSLLSVERGTESAEDRVTRQYGKRIEDARKLAITQGKVGDELERQVRALKDARDAEIKRIQDAESARKKASPAGEPTSFINPVVSGPITGKFGEQRPGHTHAGIDIAVPVGTGVKAASAGTVITAGNLPGYGNVIIVDHGAGTTTRYAHLSSILAKRGQAVSQGDVLGLSGGARGAPGSGNSQGPHLHYEVRQNGRAVDPRKSSYLADNLGAEAKGAEAAQRAAEEELRRRQTFLNELASMQGNELDARQALVVAAEEIAKLETQAIEISRKKYDDNLKSLVEQGKLTSDEADQLRKLNNERAKLRTELVQRREDQRKFRMQEADAQRKLEFQSQGYAIEEDLLRSQEGIATTAKDRHDLGRRLIDLEFQEEKIHNDAIIAQAERLKIEMERLQTLRDLSDEEKAELQRAQDAAKLAGDRNSTLGQRQGNAQTGNDRQNASPIQKWMEEVPDTADQINEALESIASGGLTSISDGIADAIVNFRSLGDVARSVVQLMLGEIAKLIIKMLILKAIKLVLGLSDGGSVGGGDGPSKAFSKAFSGFAGGGRVNFPTGGLIVGPGTSTSDSIPAITPSGRPLRVSDGEFIIKGASVRKLGLSTLNQINATGTLPMGFANGGALGVVPNNAQAASSRGSGMSVLSPDAVRQLESAVTRAASVVPPVNLYPTLEPKNAMRAMLADPGAQRMFFDFMADNTAKFNSTLRK